MHSRSICWNLRYRFFLVVGFRRIKQVQVAARTCELLAPRHVHRDNGESHRRNGTAQTAVARAARGKVGTSPILPLIHRSFLCRHVSPELLSPRRSPLLSQREQTGMNNSPASKQRRAEVSVRSTTIAAQWLAFSSKTNTTCID